MSIGVAPYTLRFNVLDKKHVEAAYKKLHDMGFDGLESGLGRGRGMSIQEDLELLEKYQLKVCDVWADVTKPDEAMAIADQYGTKIITVSAIPDIMMMTADGFKLYAERLNELGKPFAAAGYRLQYHNHSQEFRNFPELQGKTGYSILIEETDPATICFELDVYWAAGAGADPAFWVRKLKNRIPIIHFKDYAIDSRSDVTGLGSIPSRFAEIGRGNVNWPSVVEACRESGVQWFCVEQDKTVLNAFDSLQISIDFMRNKLGL